MKKYVEKRNTLVEEMEQLLKKAKEETRAFDETEEKRYKEITAEIASIDKMLKVDEEARALELNKIEDPEKKSQEEEELRAFDCYIRGVENRADAVNLDVTNNGAVIPSTIANKIIETVKNIAPVYQLATKYNVKGDLVFPVYDETTKKIDCAYATEFTALTSTSGKFTSVTLKNYLAGALTKVSISLVNASNFDLVSYIITKMAQSIAEFLEKELIVGTADKCTGILSATSGVTTASATAITADELIELQESVIKAYQPNARWLMSQRTRIAIAKLKDTTGNYLLQRDITNGFGYTLLGKPVDISDNMPEIGSGTKAVVYGDFSGLYVKQNGDITVQVMREKYLDEHAIGVIGWVDIDSKIIEPQKIRVLTCKTSA